MSTASSMRADSSGSGLDRRLLNAIPFDQPIPWSLGVTQQRVFAAEMGIFTERHEQLAVARVAAGQRNADAAGRERRRRCFAGQRRLAGTAVAVAARIAELNHETRDNAVDEHAVVKTGAGELDEARGGERRELGR